MSQSGFCRAGVLTKFAQDFTEVPFGGRGKVQTNQQVFGPNTGRGLEAGLTRKKKNMNGDQRNRTVDRALDPWHPIGSPEPHQE